LYTKTRLKRDVLIQEIWKEHHPLSPDLIPQKPGLSNNIFKMSKLDLKSMKGEG
jgi:hypothetical protein